MNPGGLGVNRIPGKWLTRQPRGHRREAPAVLRAGAVTVESRPDAARFHSPCGGRSRSAGRSRSSSIIIRSRVTLAMMEAAAMESDSASPAMTVRTGQGSCGARLPSTRARLGGVASWRSASAMAQKVACRILSRSMRATSAMPMPTCALARIGSKSASRCAALSFLESSRPSGMRAGSRITAAATTGPAQGPRPASSMPQTGARPRDTASCSNRKWGPDRDMRPCVARPQSSVNCSPGWGGRLKRSVASLTRLAFSPRRWQASSKRRPMVQA